VVLVGAGSCVSLVGRPGGGSLGVESFAVGLCSGVFRFVVT